MKNICITVYFILISLGVQGRRPSCYELPSFSRQGTLDQEAEQRGGAKLEVPGQGAGLQGRSRSETQVIVETPARAEVST